MRTRKFKQRKKFVDVDEKGIIEKFNVMDVCGKKVYFACLHSRFDFECAKRKVLIYARMDDNISMTTMSMTYSVDRRKFIRDLKVSVIYNLITEKDVDRIYSKRLAIDTHCETRYNSCADTMDKLCELREERMKLLKRIRMNNSLLEVSEYPALKELNTKYLSRLKEIERYAFR